MHHRITRAVLALILTALFILQPAKPSTAYAGLSTRTAFMGDIPTRVILTLDPGCNRVIAPATVKASVRVEGLAPGSESIGRLRIDLNNSAVYVFDANLLTGDVPSTHIRYISLPGSGSYTINAVFEGNNTYQ